MRIVTRRGRALDDPKEVLGGIWDGDGDAHPWQPSGRIGLDGVVLDDGNLEVAEAEPIGLGLVQVDVLGDDVGLAERERRSRGHGDARNRNDRNGWDEAGHQGARGIGLVKGGMREFPEARPDLFGGVADPPTVRVVGAIQGPERDGDADVVLKDGVDGKGAGRVAATEPKGEWDGRNRRGTEETGLREAIVEALEEAIGGGRLFEGHGVLVQDLEEFAVEGLDLRVANVHGGLGHEGVAEGVGPAKDGADKVTRRRRYRRRLGRGDIWHGHHEKEATNQLPFS